MHHLQNAPPEQNLLRWINFQLKRTAYPKDVKNFRSDINDGQAYLALLEAIAPEFVPKGATNLTFHFAFFQRHRVLIFRSISRTRPEHSMRLGVCVCQSNGMWWCYLSRRYQKGIFHRLKKTPLFFINFRAMKNWT